VPRSGLGAGRVRCVVSSVRILAVAVYAIASAVLLSAQQSVDSASISGRVTDASGALVVGAEVAIRQTQTNATSAAATDENGRFRFPNLKVGPYEVSVRQQGFRQSTRSLTLTAGAAFDLHVRLDVQDMEASVTVSGAATVLEAARSQIAGTISEVEVRNLPLNGRNFLDLALLVPGVSPTNVASTQLFPETSAVPGVGLSIGSQRNLSNNFIVDGLSANDDAAGLSGMTYGVDAVEQFQVVTSGGQAELGRALGGYINVVTRSGTNTIKGNAYDYLRDDRLNAANPLTATKLPMRQWQYGASVGGPVVKNRTFYFANAEQRRLDQSGLTTIAGENARAINSYLGETGYRGPAVVTGIYQNPVNSSNVLAKLDHQLTGRGQVGVRYSLYQVDSENSRGAGGLNAPTASAGLDNIDAGLSEYSQRRDSIGHAGEPHNHGSRYPERPFASGGRRDRTATRRARDDCRWLPGPAWPGSDRIDQPERSRVHRHRHQQWLPAQSAICQQQPVFVRRPVDAPRGSRGTDATAGALGALPRVVYLVEVDERHRRVLLQRTDRPI
jgi:hypothetical protein